MPRFIWNVQNRAAVAKGWVCRVTDNGAGFVGGDATVLEQTAATVAQSCEYPLTYILRQVNFSIYEN